MIVLSAHPQMLHMHLCATQIHTHLTYAMGTSRNHLNMSKIQEIRYESDKNLESVEGGGSGGLGGCEEISETRRSLMWSALLT